LIPIYIIYWFHIDKRISCSIVKVLIQFVFIKDLPTGLSISTIEGLIMKRKFTIIELLTVISIIAILMALLMPSLSRAKERALGISCMGNIKQLTFSYSLYTKDHDLNLVGSDTGRAKNDWVRRGDTPSAIKNGSMWNYTKSIGIYHCPKDFRWDKFKTVRSDYFWRAFSINGFLNGERKRDREGVTKLTQVKLSYDSVFLFVEEQDPRGFNMNSFYLKRPPGVLRTWSNADWMAPLHLKGYNISFLDGHASYIKTLNQHSITASLYKGINVPNSNVDRQKLWSYHFAR
jgi:prepilin-type processing-associated H-X9-DG protein